MSKKKRKHKYTPQELKKLEKQKSLAKQLVCGNKHPFPTKEDAEFNTDKQVYECPHCRKWHRTKTFENLIKEILGDDYSK